MRWQPVLLALRGHARADSSVFWDGVRPPVVERLVRGAINRRAVEQRGQSLERIGF